MIEPDPRSPYENLERLLTVEMRPHNMVQGFIRPMYDVARGENPVTLDIAKALLGLSRLRARASRWTMWWPAYWASRAASYKGRITPRGSPALKRISRDIT